MKTYTVRICRFPGDGWERSELTTWLSALAIQCKQDPLIAKVGFGVYSDTPITMTRNRAVKDSLAEGADYILMVDSDMSPDYMVGHDPSAKPFWDVAWNFMMRRRSIEDRDPTAVDFGFSPATIAAPYCGPPPDECCYVFHWKSWESGSPDPNFKLEMIEREDAARRSGIEEVAALPTGLILYDARVFRRMEELGELPWFDYEWGDKPYNSIKSTTEDVYQTRNASLQKLPQYVAWDSWAIHIKTKHVRKPVILAADTIRDSFAKSVKNNYKLGERLKFVSRPDDIIKLEIGKEIDLRVASDFQVDPESHADSDGPFD